MLSNISADTRIEGDYVELVMDIGEEDRWWALAAKGEFDTADYASLSARPVGGHNRLEGPMEPKGNQQSPNALHWKVSLPNGKLLPGHGINLLMSLKTNRAMPLAIHIVSDLAHFGANRQTFLFPRSRLTMRQLDHDISDLKRRTSSTETDMKWAVPEVKTQGSKITSLKGNIAALKKDFGLQIASLKKDFDLQLAGLTTATNHLFNTFVKDTHFACDPSASTLKTKNTQVEKIELQYSVVLDKAGHWGIGPRFSRSLILEQQQTKPKDGAYLGFPGAKRSATGFHGLWFHYSNGLLFEYVPHLGRLYYHGQVTGIDLSELPDHTPRWGGMGGMADWERTYAKARQDLLKKTHWTTKYSLIDLSLLQGPL
jgi:hypothetical protein